MPDPGRGPERLPPVSRARRLGLAAALCALALPWGAADAGAQNIKGEPPEIERKLRSGEFEMRRWAGARFEGDRTQQAALEFGDGEMVLVKWAKAPRGGDRFNNRPRYEVAAYELQKLFLEEAEYVVPPTVARCVPPWSYPEAVAPEAPTFEGEPCVLVVLQSWLWNVTEESVFDRGRFRRDTVYARHLANLNVLTHLIDHKDANVGNFLLSTVEGSPRVYGVDNSLAFDSEKSNRGTDWRRLRVDAVPAATVARLRELSEEVLRDALSVVAQFERSGGGMVPVEPGPPLDPEQGIRVRDGVIQLGLTEGEIGDVYARIQRLLRRVDRGNLATF